MGSGSSSNVKPLDIPKRNASPGSSQQKDDRVHAVAEDPATVSTTTPVIHVSPTPVEVVKRPSSNTKRPRSSGTEGKTIVQVANVNCEDDNGMREKLKEVERERDELRNQNVQLEKQVGEIESHNLDLIERIQVLEEQLETVTNDKVASTTAPCVNTVAAKDQYIAKLEKETSTVQEEIAKLKIKYKKKVRQMNSQLTEAKHESSLHVFEMKDELQRLKEENDELQGRLNTPSVMDDQNVSKRDPDLRPITPGADRMGLILDLSTQVSSQENKITELELKIQERDKMIEELKVSKKRDGSSKGKRSGSAKSQTSIDFASTKREIEHDDWSVDGQSLMSFTPEKRDARLPPSCNNNAELSEMKALAKEIKQAQRKVTKKKNVLKARVKTPAAHVIVDPTPDSRESSGTSRDSGVVLGDLERTLHKTQGQWMSSRPPRGGADLTSLRGEDFLELQSCNGTPSLPKTVRTASPESVISKWSDDEPESETETAAEAKSTISVSSIRRISAPKKKKKHALSDHDSMVDSLLNDIDEPIRRSTLNAEGLHPASHPISATGW